MVFLFKNSQARPARVIGSGDKKECVLGWQARGLGRANNKSSVKPAGKARRAMRTKFILRKARAAVLVGINGAGKFMLGGFFRFMHIMG